MKLETYLTKNRLTQTAFAAEVGVSQVNMNRYVRGDRQPSIGLMQKIHDATDGAVTFKDWIRVKPKTRKVPAASNREQMA